MLFLLIAGSSAIYTSASSSIHPLSEWYEQSFEKEAEGLGEFTGIELLGVLKEVKQLTFFSSKELEEVLLDALSDQLKKSTASITDYQEENKKLLEQTVTKLSEEDILDEIDSSTIEAELEEDIGNILKKVLEDN